MVPETAETIPQYCKLSSSLNTAGHHGPVAAIVRDLCCYANAAAKINRPRKPANPPAVLRFFTNPKTAKQ